MGQSEMTTNKCQVVGGDKLPAATGGPKLICEAIDSAARDLAPRKRFAVQVRVQSPSLMSAVVTLTDGRKLPEQNIAVSDSTLNRRSIERFAEAIARQVAGAGA